MAAVDESPGPDPSGLIYGSMGLGGGWDDSPLEPSQVEAAEAALDAASGIGISWIDTADIYCNGKSERVLGEVLQNRPDLRRHFSIQTKFGIRVPGNTTTSDVAHYRQDADTVLASVEGCLARLRTDHLDALLIHRPSPLIDRAGTARALDRLIDEGTVGRIGVSNMSHHQMAALQAHLNHPLQVNQLQLSLAHRDFVEFEVGVNADPAVFPAGTLEYALAHGVQIQAWSPLAGGRYDPDQPADTGRQEDPAVLATRTEVARQARAGGVTPTAILLAWLMRHPSGIVPVIGSSRPQRIMAAADAARAARAMSDEDWWKLFLTARGGAVR